MRKLTNELFIISLFITLLLSCFIVDSQNKKSEIIVSKPIDSKIKEKLRTNNNNKITREKSPKPTAQCRDGSMSYSNSRRGSCSWKGGVAKWLK